MFRERTLASQRIYEGRVINLRKDTVESKSGHPFIREVVEHPGATAIVPVTEDGKLILIRQYRHATGKTLLEIPAGTLDPRETVEACARRELLEETGYRARQWTKLFHCYLAPGYSSELIHVYLARRLSRGVQEVEEDERIRVVEVTLAEAVKMIRRNEIQDAKTISGILAAQLFGA